MSTDTNRMIEWFAQNTCVVSVDTVIQTKDRFNIGERARLRDRAAFLLAQKLIDAGLVATTTARTPQGDILRLQVQGVRPAVWCPAHNQIFDVVEVPSEAAPLGPSKYGEHPAG